MLASRVEQLELPEGVEPDEERDVHPRPPDVDRPGDRLVELDHSRVRRPARTTVAARDPADPALLDRMVRHVVAGLPRNQPDSDAPADASAGLEILNRHRVPPAAS